jgi:streptogramin lyase
VLSPSLGSISRPYDIAFDGHGDLWVANYGDSTVVGFSPSQIATSGRPLPYAGLSGSQGTTNCLTMAFDAQGDLWVGTLTDSVSEFTAGQLTSIGAPNPAVVLALGHTVQEIQALAFDNSGALWVLDNQRNKLLRYAPDQLTTSGAPMAADTINVGTGTFPQWIAFSPHAAGLPLN